MSKSVGVILIDASKTEGRFLNWHYILQKLDYSADTSDIALNDIPDLDDIKSLDVAIAYNSVVDILTITGLSFEQCNAICVEHIPQLKTHIDDKASLFFVPASADAGESIDCINLIASENDNIHFEFINGEFTEVPLDTADLVGSN